MPTRSACRALTALAVMLWVIALALLALNLDGDDLAPLPTVITMTAVGASLLAALAYNRRAILAQHHADDTQLAIALNAYPPQYWRAYGQIVDSLLDEDKRPV